MRTNFQLKILKTMVLFSKLFQKLENCHSIGSSMILIILPFFFGKARLNKKNAPVTARDEVNEVIAALVSRERVWARATWRGDFQATSMSQEVRING